MLRSSAIFLAFRRFHAIISRMNKEKVNSMQENKTGQYSLLKMTWPIFIELFLQILVGNIDQLMLSRYNETAVAAVGNANQIITILLLSFTVINLAATILISRSIGADDMQSVRQIYSLSALVNLVLGGTLCVLVLLLGTSLLRWMKVPAELMPEALVYLRITALALPFHALMMTLGSFLRAHAKMGTITLVTGISNIINILGNAAFIYGVGFFPELGAAGAALSTSICRIAGMGMMLFAFYRKVDGAYIGLRVLRPFPKQLFKKLLEIGMPAGGESLSYNFSQMAGLVFINTLGTYVVSTRMYCVMYAQICYMLIIAVSQAGQIIVSYHVGAQEYEEADRQCVRILRIFTPITVGITIVLCIFAKPITALLTNDVRIIELAQKILMLEIVLEIGRCYNIVLVRNLQAVGDVRFPVAIGIASQWLIAVGLAYLLCIRCGLGLAGMWIAFVVDENMRAVIFRIRWKRGAWKQRLAQEDECA